LKKGLRAALRVLLIAIAQVMKKKKTPINPKKENKIKLSSREV